MIQIPEICGRCKRKTKPEKIRMEIWPLKDIINGDGAWLCNKCHKEMQVLLKEWMKNK